MTDITGQVCQWVLDERCPNLIRGDIWHSECGSSYMLESGVTPSEMEWKYCCYCGKQLSEVEGGDNE